MRTARLARQPVLGLWGATLVIPVTVVLAVGWGGPERSLLVLGPISTFALPVIAMVAFWWEDWPGTLLRSPLTGLVDTLLVVAGGVVSTVAGRAIVDPDAPTFPGTMPLAGAIFVAMLQLTLVLEGRSLLRVGRFAGGVLAMGASWAIGVALFEALVAGDGVVADGVFGAALVCVGVLQVAFYVVLGGWPFTRIGPVATRVAVANVAVLGGGIGLYLLLAYVGTLAPATISALAGAAVAAGLVIGMLFEGWLDSRLANVVAVAAVAALLYVVLRAFAEAAGWSRAEPEEWIAYAGLNAIGAGVILHVAIGHRWPFAR
jgi:uncharacterized membrane protein